jgi:hypothetical protein
MEGFYMKKSVGTTTSSLTPKKVSHQAVVMERRLLKELERKNALETLQSIEESERIIAQKIKQGKALKQQ